MGRGFNGLGGHGCFDREAALHRFRRNSTSMKRPHPDRRNHQARRRVASLCLLSGLAFLASSWTVRLPTTPAGSSDDRRLSSSSSSTYGKAALTIDADGVKHFTPHGPYLGRLSGADRTDARRLELSLQQQAAAEGAQGDGGMIGGGANLFQKYAYGFGSGGGGGDDKLSRSRRITANDQGTTAADAAYDGDEAERTLTSNHAAPKRIALVRPFAPFSAGEIMASFDSFDTYWPCTSNPLHPFDTESEPGEGDAYPYEYVVDLFLSFSQTYDDYHPSDLSYRVKEDLKQKFNNNGGWNGCFDKLYNIEAGIAPAMDQYEHNNVQTNRHWVNGPNTQFRSIMNTIIERNQAMASKTNGGGDYYEAVVLLEGDAHVQQVGWLDFLLDEVVAKAPFAILGSSYRGFSWDNFRNQLPQALLEHKNGNAAYNITHPLTQHYVQELKEERATYFNSIAYDYRISQMIVEGRDGTPPEFPFPEIIDESTEEPVVLPPKKAKFQSWWNQWGGPDVIKESDVISNWAATNYLPQHISDGSPIVHGKGAFLPFDDTHHKITLVVTDWDENFAESLLSTIDSSDHPFSEILIVKSPSASEAESHSLWETVSSMWHSNTPTSIPVRYVDRTSPDFLDLCDADVATEWFMLTNSYHDVAANVDLMFSHDDPPRPLIAYTPASSKHCTNYQACVETVDLAKTFKPEIDKVILDLDMVYHTSSRNAFCHEWKKKNGDEGELLFDRLGGSESNLSILQSGIPRGPTATAYYAYLANSGMADNIYAFTNRLDHGAVDHFVKRREEEEAERHLAALGQVPTQQRMAKEVQQQSEKPGPPQDAEAVALHMAALQGNFGSVRRMDVVDVDVHDDGSVRRKLQSANEEEPGFFSRLWQRFVDFFRRLFFIKTEEDEPYEPVVDVTRYDDTDGAESSTDRASPVSPNRAKSGGLQFAAQTSANSLNITLDDEDYPGGSPNRELVMERPGWLVQKDRSRNDQAFVARQARKRAQARKRTARREQAKRRLHNLFF